VAAGVVITNLGHQAVWALDCHALAYDNSGLRLFQRDFNPAPPAGAYVVAPWDESTPSSIR